MDNYQFCVHFLGQLYPDKSNVRVLDYGCGRATTVTLLRARSFEAYGCDLFYGGESWRSDVPPEYFAHGIVRDMTDDRIPFADNMFDAVVSNQVFEHVPDLKSVLDEISRVLRPGGVLLFLFPDRSIWREGHYGIPFHHWFPKSSRLRLVYTALCRLIGLGYHKGTKSIIAWSEEACDWIDRWTYYRPYDELRQLFAVRFVNFQHHEAYWLSTRFGARGSYVRRMPDIVKVAVVRKWAGMVGTCRKPLEAASPAATAQQDAVNRAV